MANPSKDNKKRAVLDSFFREKPKPAPRQPVRTETLEPDYPDLRHEENHFETLSREEQSTRTPKPVFLSLEEPSEEAKNWHVEHFLPNKPATPKPEDLRLLIKRLLESDQWRYFLEHLGDFSSDENRLLRSLLKDKFDLSLLLNDLNNDRWEGFLDVVKFQPWFRERLLRNGIDLEALMLDFPDEPMKLLRAFKEDFIQASTENLNELNAIMNQLNDKERDELLFEIIGIDKLCDNIKNATQLARFLKILTEDEFTKFIETVNKQWLEGVMGSSNGIATVLDILKRTSSDSFDRQKKLLDELGGLDWLKDCLLFDRYRNIYGLAPVARTLNPEQLFKLLIDKLGVANIPYVTVDFATMLIVLHGVPAGMQADLALALIRENIQYGLAIIEHAPQLVSLMKDFEPKEQEKLFSDLSLNPGKEWLRTLTPTLSALTDTLEVLTPKVQTQVLTTLFTTEEIVTQASTLTDKEDFITLWQALPPEFPYTTLVESIPPEKMESFFKSDEVPTLIWSKVDNLPDLIQLTEALPSKVKVEFLLSPESIKSVKQLVAKNKEEESQSLGKKPGKLFFSTNKEEQNKVSLKILEKLLTKPEDKKKLQELLAKAPDPNLKSGQGK